jgi:hypothetical protein
LREFVRRAGAIPLLFGLVVVVIFSGHTVIVEACSGKEVPTKTGTSFALEKHPHIMSFAYININKLDKLYKYRK